MSSSQLTKYLSGDEKVIWSGKPERVPFVFRGFAGIVPALFFMGFSIFWMSLASQAGGGFWLFGLIFFLTGFGMAFGTPIWQLMRYNNTEYMITDKRIITQTGAIGLDTRFVNLDKIQEVYVQVGLIDRMVGTGTVYATTAGYVYVNAPGSYARPNLAALKNPYEVQKLLQDALEKIKTTPTML